MPLPPPAAAPRPAPRLRLGFRLTAVSCGLALGILGCNFVAGGVGVGVFAGASYLLWQCYDHAMIDVRRADTGTLTCDADVRIQRVGDGDDSEDDYSTVRPCYHASLSEGRWKIEARMPGFLPISTWVTVEEHSGMCPGYTHSIELSLQPERGEVRRLRARQVSPPRRDPSLPPPAPPDSTATPAQPTKAFGLEPPAPTEPKP